ncbi:uncharacterized protein LOC111713584 [Eurytemora carolleeae]|uniref:uncharacterized protein LOC111713584 n=1 Tax=Eurytemora carolleeae TaxID=1294199 RepID=UPI000C761B4E|nr:uncharacterized protein LOC111713584 [Eurytemora carolleeae]|eukprot:XP_023344231.1 uncharacterized protein LOC111713584 [Eurytemora affinis]
MNNAVQLNIRRIFLRKKWRDNLLSRGVVNDSFQLREAWQERLQAPVFSKIKMGEYFVELDKKFANEYRGSAVDVDIFANNVKTDTQAEHMEELLHKLRRTPHTVHTSPSTQHAAVRSMLDHGEISNLVKMLDDRRGGGPKILLEAGELRAAARCASQLMLQEENYTLPSALGNLSCWRYYSSGRQDPWFYPEEIQVDENPDEVIRVRVKVVPNNYFDDHFDLRDPDRILGKTLIHFNSGSSDTVSRSLNILGNFLFGNQSRVIELLASGEVAQSVLDALAENEELKDSVSSAKAVELDLDESLLSVCRDLENNVRTDLTEKQKNLYKQWNQERNEELQRQYEVLQRAARVEAISQTKANLLKTEEKLFFFENLDRYEIEKEDKVKAWVRTLPKTNWNMKNYPQRAYYKKREVADGERKIARWEKRELKKGPPK